MSRFRLAALAVAAALVVLLPGAAARADAPGNLLYRSSSAQEDNIYARTIELAHAGAQNGRLVSTFEHDNRDGTPVQLVVRSSDDDGASWSTLATVPDPMTGAGHPVSHIWQPALYEFPRALGRFPAGTLLLAANLVPDDVSYTQFYVWRSTDHGRTWRPVGPVQRGGPGGTGIWEPYFALDRAGQLVMYFSDERDSPRHSQLLVHLVSKDGGATWGPVVRDVASTVAADRPGMPTVVRMGPKGDYLMTFEVCGRPNCEVRWKTSPDGVHWRPADLGTLVETSDGRYLGHSPYVAWDQRHHRLLLAAQRVYARTGHQPTGEDYRAVFVNDRGGRGAWSWAPAPWTVSATSPDCNANYSPNLLVQGDVVRLTAPTSDGTAGACDERTGTAPVGLLPYRDAFATAGDAGWIDYGGPWRTTGGTYETTGGGDVGAKALTGSTGWKDYTVAADVRITSDAGDAGVLSRVTDPAVGPDSHAGYLAFLDVRAGTFNLARQQYAYEPFASAPVPGGLKAGTWYRVSLAAKGYALTAKLTPAGGGATTTLRFTDPYRSFGHGAAGLRAHAGTAAFRNVRIQ